MVRYQGIPALTIQRVRRGLAATLLVLYALVVVGLPVAHELSTRSGRPGAIHVEQAGGESCAPVHNHLNCSFCQSSRANAVPADPVVLPVPVVRCADLVAADRDSPVRPSPDGPLGPRAPPHS